MHFITGDKTHRIHSHIHTDKFTQAQLLSQTHVRIFTHTHFCWESEICNGIPPTLLSASDARTHIQRHTSSALKHSHVCSNAPILSLLYMNRNNGFDKFDSSVVYRAVQMDKQVVMGWNIILSEEQVDHGTNRNTGSEDCVSQTSFHITELTDNSDDLSCHHHSCYNYHIVVR